MHRAWRRTAQLTPTQSTSPGCANTWSTSTAVTRLTSQTIAKSGSGLLVEDTGSIQGLTSSPCHSAAQARTAGSLQPSPVPSRRLQT
eukprot:4287843-Pyramimonas_sp.AAC.1